MNIDVRKALTQSDSEDNIRVTLNVWAADTPELRAIMTKHLPAWADLFARKNSEYGSGSAFDLGERGQFSDIYRKIIKLKRALWDEDESVLTTESVDEILMDLIGHCFLTLEMRRRAIESETWPNLSELGQPIMTQQQFEQMVSETGMLFLRSGPNQEDQNSTSHWVAPGDRPLDVGDRVRLKQHLGKGPVYTISSFDPQDPKGMIVELGLPDETSIWVHPTWVYKENEKSPEELHLERDEHGFFKDDPNTVWQRNDGRPVKDNPQA